MSDISRTVTFNAGAPNRSQDTGARMQRRFLLACGFACTALAGVTMMANGLFASKFGANGVETGLMVVGSVGVDVLKIGLPIPLFYLWERSKPLFAVGAALWLACFCWSLFSAYGFVVTLRSEKAAETATAIEDRGGIQARIRRAESQLAALPRYRPEAALAKAVEVEEQRLGITERSGDRCARNTNWARENCGALRALREELASASSAAGIERAIAADRARLSGIHVASSSADPQIAGLAAVTGIAASVLTTIATIFFAALIEAASAIGPVITAQGARYAKEVPEEEPLPEADPQLAAPAIGSLQDGFNRWAGDMIEMDAGCRLTSQEAYRAYARWAPFHQVDRGTPESFGKLFAGHARALGCAEGRNSKTAYFAGIKLRTTEPIKLLTAAQ